MESRMITRRTALAGAAALPATWAATPALADVAALEAAARKEGSLTWYTSHTDGEFAQAAASAFMAQYPGIKVVHIRTTAQVAYQRLLQDLKNGIANCDVFSSTDLGHDEALRIEGKFARYMPENAAALRPEYRGLDPADTYFATLSELVVLIHNTTKVKAADSPKNWPDLLNPRWRNQIAIGHPAYSGTVGTWVVAMRKLYGWSYFERLEKNRPLIGRSVNDAVSTLNSGERIVGMSTAGISQLTALRGNPVGLDFPTEGAVQIVSPSAIMANAPHPNAARLFMEWLMGPAHARLSAEAGRRPVRMDDAALTGTAAGGIPADAKVLRLSTAEIVKGIPEVIEQWRDTFGG